MAQDTDQLAVLSSTRSKPAAPVQQSGGAVASTPPRGSSVLSANTLRAYATDWCAFSTWCQASRVSPLPASSAVVAGYLADGASGLGRSGLRRRLAAIAHMHRSAGQPWEPSHPVVADALSSALASRSKPARPTAALTSMDMQRLLEACGSGLAGLRDRALLLLGFAGALRRSELVAVDREHLGFTPEGMEVLITDLEHDGGGEGVTLRIGRDQDLLLCPARAMEDWLRRSRIEYGPVFCRMSVGGALEGRLTPQGVWRVLRKRAGIAQLTVHETERLSPHGLRAGSVARAR